MKELERENEQMCATIETLRSRNEQTIDLRVKDIEKENKKMSETVTEVTQKLSQLDYEYRNLQKTHTGLQDKVERIEQVRPAPVTLWHYKRLDLKSMA